MQQTHIWQNIFYCPVFVCLFVTAHTKQFWLAWLLFPEGCSWTSSLPAGSLPNSFEKPIFDTIDTTCETIIEKDIWFPWAA